MMSTEELQQHEKLIIANRELKKAEEQFRLVVESAPNAIVLINDQGVITLVNTQTEKLFEFERSEMIGSKVEMLIPERYRNRHTDFRNMFFEKLQTRPMGAGFDLFARKKNGAEVQVEIGLNPIETAKGQMVLASIVDITERKIQEAMLKKQNKELEQFAYIASHDLQEPLRTVRNYIGLLEKEYSETLDDNAHRYFQRINNATKRMSLLIKSLLHFSRLGQNSVLVNIDFNVLIEEVLADLEAIINDVDAVIETTDMPRCYVYETEIRQVFHNLIINAIKFRKADNRLHIKISAEKENDKWKFSVSDNGIGIAPEYFEKIFDIFQRLHSKSQHEGSGIGLANCKKIVELHKGEIWVESKPGEGTTFYFTIANLHR